MVNLPNVGERVKVWPMPGRAVQLSVVPLDAGGRWMPKDGAEVVWSHFHLEQLRAGDILFHSPVAAAVEPVAAVVEK
jgi:hypothetical protein